MLLKKAQIEKPAYIFHNEYLGESYDVGAKILTLDDLKLAATSDVHLPTDFPNGQYVVSGMGIDWGGRGKERVSDTDDFISNTAIALGGMLPDGTIEVTWLHKVPYQIDLSDESKLIAQAAAAAHVDWMAMDYGGQGNVQLEMVRATGYPLERMVPFTYQVMAPSRPIVYYNPPQARGVRHS
jgi:hypothetical protein